MAKAKVEITKDHTIIIPETVLEIHSSNGTVTKGPTLPEKVIQYKAGTIHDFRSKKDAMAFVNALGTEVAKLL